MQGNRKERDREEGGEGGRRAEGGGRKKEGGRGQAVSQFTASALLRVLRDPSAFRAGCLLLSSTVFPKGDGEHLLQLFQHLPKNLMFLFDLFNPAL